MLQKLYYFQLNKHCDKLSEFSSNECFRVDDLFPKINHYDTRDLKKYICEEIRYISKIRNIYIYPAGGEYLII